MSEQNGYWSPYIGDGYDEEATIPAHPGRWSEIKIRYRCMSADEESETRDKAKRFPGSSPVRHFAELFATKIQWWDLKDRAGKVVPITVDSIARLSPQFNDVLHSYLDGTLPSDEAKQRLEDHVKNSSPGSG